MLLVESEFLVEPGARRSYFHNRVIFCEAINIVIAFRSSLRDVQDAFVIDVVECRIMYGEIVWLFGKHTNRQ